MSTVPERSEINPEYKWDLESIFGTDDEWEAAYHEAAERVEDLDAYEGRITESGETLLEALELRDDLMRRVGTVTAYARMRSDEDTRDQAYQAMSIRAQSLHADAASAASFIEPAIQSLDPDELDAMRAQTPGLDAYAHYLDDVMRLKPHTRSTEIEELLSDLGEVLGAANDAYSMLLNADMTFPTVDRDGEPIEITQSNFTKLLKATDRPFRQTVHEEFYSRLEAVRNTVGSTLKNSIKTDVKLARARHYETAREAAMDHANIPEEVYDTLVQTVRDNLHTLHRHVELKETALDLDTIRMWDLYMPVPDSPSPTISYDEATEHVIDAVAPLGATYKTLVSDGLASRWVDVYENRGKQSGAYSGGTYDTQPFILMNWQDDVTSMFTLAHELGHSLHSELTSQHQPYVYSQYEIFVAEVASTVNETLLTHHLLDTIDDDDFRLHVLNEYLERFRSTLYRQTMFADYEHQLHTLSEDDDPLTPDRFDALYADLKAEFYEPAAIDDAIKREWMRIPHFYYNYYVYQYATGISAAVAIVDRILNDGDAADDYLAALKMGGSAYPLEIIERAGVDMTSSTPIETAIDEYDRQLDEMAAIISA